MINVSTTRQNRLSESTTERRTTIVAGIKQENICVQQTVHCVDASVTVVKDETSITVKKEGSSFVNDAGDVLNEETAGKLFDTLAGLRIQRYITEPPTLPVPSFRMEIALKEGQIIHFDVFMKEGMPPEGTNDEKWFILDAETVQTLMSDLTKPST